MVNTQCLKITEKVSFNGASEASYDYIMSRQKFIKNAKNGPFKPETYGETVLPDRSILIGQKFIKNAKNGLFKPETYGEIVLPDRSILIRQKFIKNVKKCPFCFGQTVFPDRSLFNRTTSGEKCLNWKFQMRHFW